MDFPNFNDYFRVGRDEVLRRNGLLTSAAVDRQGSDINVDVAASAASADEVTRQLVGVAAGVFLDSARGRRLDKLVFDRYALFRKPAAPALVSVKFSVVDGSGALAANPSAFTIPAGTTLQSLDGIQFITTADGIYLTGQVTPLLVAARSVLAGANQATDVNQITSITSPVPGEPASPLTLVVNNTIASAGAADQENDDSLRNRARQFFTTARKGTRAAIEEQALAVPGVQTASAIEVLDALGRPARLVVLIIADAFTDNLAQYSQAIPTYSAQSQLLTATTFAALDDTRCAGIYVQVIVASIVLLSVQLRLSFQAGINIDQVAANARAAVVNYTNALQPGSPWLAADCQAAIAAVQGLAITGNELAGPPGNVIPTPLQAIRTSLTLVSTVSAQANNVLIVSTNPDAFASAA